MAEEKQFSIALDNHRYFGKKGIKKRKSKQTSSNT